MPYGQQRVLEMALALAQKPRVRIALVSSAERPSGSRRLARPTIAASSADTQSSGRVGVSSSLW